MEARARRLASPSRTTFKTLAASLRAKYADLSAPLSLNLPPFSSPLFFIHRVQGFCASSTQTQPSAAFCLFLFLCPCGGLFVIHFFCSKRQHYYCRLCVLLLSYFWVQVRIQKPFLCIFVICLFLFPILFFHAQKTFVIFIWVRVSLWVPCSDFLFFDIVWLLTF